MGLNGLSGGALVRASLTAEGPKLERMLLWEDLAMSLERRRRPRRHRGGRKHRRERR